MRNSVTAALLTAAVGVPYTATETELGRTALKSLQSQSAEVVSTLSSYGDAANSHREVERVLEKGIEKYRYPTPPQVLTGLPYPPTAGVPAGLPPATLGATPPPGYGYPASGTPSQTVSYGPGAGAMASGSAADPATGAAAALTPGHPGNGSAAPFANPATAYQAPPIGLGPSLVGGPIHDLREVLRFDISPDWVTARFARVSTVLAETQLEGLRVPLVTGIGTTDLAGTVTYYFDYSGKLQRIMLHGLTGDVSKLVETMTLHYGLATEPTLDAGVYTRRWNNVPVHFLRLTRAPVVYSDALHHKFTVFLELNQPDLRFGISEEAKQIIDTDRRTGRW